MSTRREESLPKDRNQRGRVQKGTVMKRFIGMGIALAIFGALAGSRSASANVFPGVACWGFTRLSYNGTVYIIPKDNFGIAYFTPETQVTLIDGECIMPPFAPGPFVLPIAEAMWNSSARYGVEIYILPWDGSVQLKGFQIR